MGSPVLRMLKLIQTKTMTGRNGGEGAWLISTFYIIIEASKICSSFFILFNIFKIARNFPLFRTSVFSIESTH